MTPKVQRIGILVIAVVMIVGTLGSFAMLVLANQNSLDTSQQAAQDAQKAAEEQQKQTDTLSAQYYPIFKDYQSSPATFDADTVGDSVTSSDIKVGDGATISSSSTYKAYYIGWNPKGTVFDSSFDGTKLKAPIDVAPGGLISGWYDGVDGMKIGGIREITIPSDKAYADKGNGDNIPPNTPIKFIIMAIPS